VSIPKAAEEAAIEPTTKARPGSPAPRITHKVEQNATTKLYSVCMSYKPYATGAVQKTGKHPQRILHASISASLNSVACVLLEL
jgi:hypothetical protein